MFDAAFRRAFARAAAPLARGLVRAGVTPDALTVGGAGLAVGAALLLAGGRPLAGLAAWLASRLCDGFDGLVAREGGGGSAFGGYLDLTLDMVGYGAMVLAFAHVHPAHPLLWGAMLTGYLLVTTSTLALSSLLEARARRVPGNDRSLQFTPGLAEAGETSIAYTLFVLWPGQVAWLGWGWVVVLALTVAQRTLLARRLLG